MNLATLLERTAAAHVTRPAVTFGEEVHATYATFRERVRLLAGGLRTRWNARSGDRIALFAANHPSYLEAMYAAWWAGLVVVPINCKLHVREARFILEDSGAIACWTDAERGSELRAIGVATPLVDLEAIGEHRASEPIAIEPRSMDDLAWLFYTSGTTGRPKGALLTHGNLLHMTQGYIAEVQSVEPGDALLHAAPVSHGSGLYNMAYIAHAGINAFPLSCGFDEDEVLTLAARYPGVAMFAAPTMVKRLVAACMKRPGSAHSIGTIVYGGGPMYLADIQEALRVMGPRFAQIYGQGETPMTITVLPKHVIADSAHPQYLRRLASVGHAQMMVELSIRDDEGHPLPPGEIGEICVRSPVVMQGYWNNPEATRAALRDGWLYTGDVGVLDEDGFLTLRDRSKDVIISGASNIYPREVEEVLLEHPRVREVSVVGAPDPEWGESVVAFVVAEDVTAEELDRLCLANIARFKRPKHYRFIAELPKNNYGKVLKTELRKLLAESTSSS